MKIRISLLASALFTAACGNVLIVPPGETTSSSDGGSPSSTTTDSSTRSETVSSTSTNTTSSVTVTTGSGGSGTGGAGGNGGSGGALAPVGLDFNPILNTAPPGIAIPGPNPFRSYFLVYENDGASVWISGTKVRLQGDMDPSALDQVLITVWGVPCAAGSIVEYDGQGPFVMADQPVASMQCPVLGPAGGQFEVIGIISDDPSGSGKQLGLIAEEIALSTDPISYSFAMVPDPNAPLQHMRLGQPVIYVSALPLAPTDGDGEIATVTIDLESGSAPLSFIQLPLDVGMQDVSLSNLRIVRDGVTLDSTQYTLFAGTDPVIAGTVLTASTQLTLRFSAEDAIADGETREYVLFATWAISAPSFIFSVTMPKADGPMPDVPVTGPLSGVTILQVNGAPSRLIWTDRPQQGFDSPVWIPGNKRNIVINL